MSGQSHLECFLFVLIQGGPDPWDPKQPYEDWKGQQVKPAPVASWTGSLGDLNGSLNQMMMEVQVNDEITSAAAALQPGKGPMARPAGKAPVKVGGQEAGGKGGKQVPAKSPVSLPLGHDQDFSGVADFLLKENDEQLPAAKASFSAAPGMSTTMFSGAPGMDSSSIVTGWAAQSNWSSVSASWDSQAKPVSVNYATAFSAVPDSKFCGNFTTSSLGLGLMQPWLDGGGGSSPFQESTTPLFGGGPPGTPNKAGKTEVQAPAVPQWSAAPQVPSWSAQGTTQKSAEQQSGVNVPQQVVGGQQTGKFSSRGGMGVKPARGRGAGRGGQGADTTGASPADTSAMSTPAGDSTKASGPRPSRGTYQAKSSKRVTNVKPEGDGSEGMVRADASSSGGENIVGGVGRGGQVSVRGRGGTKIYVPKQVRQAGEAHNKQRENVP